MSKRDTTGNNNTSWRNKTSRANTWRQQMKYGQYGTQTEAQERLEIRQSAAYEEQQRLAAKMATEARRADPLVANQPPHETPTNPQDNLESAALAETVILGLNPHHIDSAAETLRIDSAANTLRRQLEQLKPNRRERRNSQRQKDNSR